MTTATATSFPPLPKSSPARALKAAATFWFTVTAVGQLMFVLYILGFHGRAVVQGHPETVNKVLPKGKRPTLPPRKLDQDCVEFGNGSNESIWLFRHVG
ncbi:hypothetical protein, partial [Duganella sp. Root336D2]|uniref:hypothetical protein n=1 Tax=Duganella sp. Root336D2 TaxID=1736518 RepID=UPI000A9CC591